MNSKQTYIGIAIIVFIFGLLTIPKIIERVRNGQIVDHDRLNVVQAKSIENPTEGLAYINIDGNDKKVPSFKLINQTRDTITPWNYKGKVFVVEFFFTRCPDICIPMSHNLIEIQNEFLDRKDFGIVSITIDPEHDTPEVLKDYAKTYGAVHPNWNYLTGSMEDIYKIANEGFNLNAQVNPNLEGSFIHSGLFALVDQNGFIRSRYDQYGNPLVYYRGSIPSDDESNEEGETQQIDILIEDIKDLLK